MAVTSHVYPVNLLDALAQTGAGHVKFSADTFKVGLCTASAATWSSTQQAFQFVSSVTAAYTEVSSSGYARQSLAGATLTRSTNTLVFTCTSPISFGSTITLAAASMFIFDSTIGSGVDSATPVIGIVDFGATITSTAGAWTYTVDPVVGLFTITCS